MEKRKFNVLDFLYPRRCPVCHDAIDRRGNLICNSCEKLISYTKYPTCLVCGKEIGDESKSLCYDCEDYKKHFKKNFAIINYDDIARRSMVMFKYKGRREYADYYVSEFLKRRGDEIKSTGVGLIIPVPVHESRLKERGYNQAAVLGKLMSKGLGIPMREDILLRYKKTEAQKKLGMAGRIGNISSALKVTVDLSTAPPILLVDDIYTTGATLTACAKMLVEAGAKKVFGACICIGRDS